MGVGSDPRRRRVAPSPRSGRRPSRRAAVPGPHNRGSAAATAAARVAGIEEAAFAEALCTFEGVPHRIELVRELRGTRYVNDSKATNVAAALRALASFPDARLHVILGGRGKHESYAPLVAAFKDGDRAYLVGEAAEEIAQALGATGVPFTHAGTLENAVDQAAEAAAPGEIVLLSPACASFDQFRDFEAPARSSASFVSKLAGAATRARRSQHPDLSPRSASSPSGS